MTQEQTERMWFRRVVSVVMVACVTFGAFPVVKNFMFPVAKVR